jgi:hypothetical protein
MLIAEDEIVDMHGLFPTGNFEENLLTRGVIAKVGKHHVRVGRLLGSVPPGRGTLVLVLAVQKPHVVSPASIATRLNKKEINGCIFELLS